MKEISNFCYFCDHCLENRLRDRIVVGTRDELALKRMLEDNTLTLQTATDICRASESANQCSAVIRGSSNHTVNKLSNYKKNQKTSIRPKSGLCFRCGKDCRNDKQGCRAIDKICSKCGTRGHLAVVCQKSVRPPRSETPKPISKQESSNTNKDGKKVYQLLAGVYTNRVTVRPAPKVTVKAMHPAGIDMVTWTPDSGAETTVIGLDTAESLGISPSTLVPSDNGIYAAGQHRLTCVGNVPITSRTAQ